MINMNKGKKVLALCLAVATVLTMTAYGAPHMAPNRKRVNGAVPTQRYLPGAGHSRDEIVQPGLCPADGSRKSTSEATLSYWSEDSAAAASLKKYVADVTDPDKEGFIPVKDRIAVFDMNGTLTCETFYTYYDTMMFIEFCLKDHPEKVSEELKKAAREIKPGYIAGEALARNFAKAYEGMTVEELYDYAVEFGQKETDSFNHMRYIDGFYLPMAEVVKYLYENDFTIYIVSGTERTTTRAIVDHSPIREYVAPEHVIGTEFEVKVKGYEDVSSNMDFKYADGNELVFSSGFIQKNLNANKAIWIEREIGRRPVLAFGNSGSDTSMMNYVLDERNPYPSAAYMVVADDDVREWGTQDWEEKSAQYEEQGYVPISMKNDFLKIYPEPITRADTQYTQPLEEKYTLEQVVVLSRHNLRAPLSSNGSVPDELTPHQWINWTAGSSELTLLGGMEETSMGQYFRKWLNQEGLIPENYIPEDGEVRFNARDKQRCRATARSFATGMLPLADITVEHPGDDLGTEDFMKPVLHFYNEEYAADAIAQVAAMGGEDGFEGLGEQNRDVIRLIMNTVDMEDSQIYQSGKYGDLLTDPFGYTMKGVDTEPDITGAAKTASQVADALLMQYYEEPDDVKAAFGHDLKAEDWARIGAFVTTCLEMRHGAPLVASNIANPLLKELQGELTNDERKFSFFCSHDLNVLGTLSALGVEDFCLPESIETKAPIGGKLVFERRRDTEGQVWYRVNLVYRSTEQIRSRELLSLDNPPQRFELGFAGVDTNEDGLIAEADLLALFDRSIAVLDEMEEVYGLEDAA